MIRKSARANVPGTPSGRLSRLRSLRFSHRGAATWIGLTLLIIYIGLAAVGLLQQADPNALVALGPEPPSWAHPFGTDILGRDLLVRVSAGAWTSFTTSLAVIVFALIFALPVGVYAAWRHREWPDHLLMHMVETTQIVPQFILAIVILGIAGASEVTVLGVRLTMTIRLIICLGIGFIPFFTRVTRTAVLLELEETYVNDLQLLGVPNREVLFGEVLPNVAPVIAVQAFLAFAIAVFAEGGLSYLGLGIPPPAPTLGNLITEAGSQLLDGAWWYAVIPGLVLVAGITGGNLVADTLTDRAFDTASHNGRSVDSIHVHTRGLSETTSPTEPTT